MGVIMPVVAPSTVFGTSEGKDAIHIEGTLLEGNTTNASRLETTGGRGTVSQLPETSLSTLEEWKLFSERPRVMRAVYGLLLVLNMLNTGLVWVRAIFHGHSCIFSKPFSLVLDVRIIYQAVRRSHHDCEIPGLPIIVQKLSYHFHAHALKSAQA
jgi:hypothetical protein